MKPKVSDENVSVIATACAGVVQQLVERLATELEATRKELKAKERELAVWESYGGFSVYKQRNLEIHLMTISDCVAMDLKKEQTNGNKS